jgi:hypothetical protein
MRWQRSTGNTLMSILVVIQLLIFGWSAFPFLAPQLGRIAADQLLASAPKMRYDKIILARR